MGLCVALSFYPFSRNRLLELLYYSQYNHARSLIIVTGATCPNRSTVQGRDCFFAWYITWFSMRKRSLAVPFLDMLPAAKNNRNGSGSAVYCEYANLGNVNVDCGAEWPLLGNSRSSPR